METNRSASQGAGCAGVRGHVGKPETSLSFCMAARMARAMEQTVGASFKDLIVWQRAVDLSVEVYRLTATFPSSEQFGLVNQMRRASVSIASNIAEGYGRPTRGEYLQFLGVARASNCELQTQLIISGALGFGAKRACESVDRLSADVSRLLIALFKALKK